MNWLYLIAAAFTGALFGVFEAEIIAFSLYQITTSFPFAIAFGVGFCLLAFALAWRIWVSVEGTPRYVLLGFALLVLASGISCFCLGENWSKSWNTGGKIPLYSLIGISFAFTMTYIFSELATIAPWDKCCGTDHTTNPIFGSPKQIFALFGSALGLGFVFGLMFGLTNTSTDGTGSNEDLFHNALYGIPIGFAGGALFGLANEFYRQRGQYIEINADSKDIHEPDHL